MTDRNLDIALRIKADLAAAHKGLEEINQDLANTGKQADTAAQALGRSGQRFDAMLASTGRMVGLLESMDARLASLVDGSVQVARATEQVSSGTEAASTSMRRLAETEDEAAARIRAVIAASREQAAAQVESNQAAQQAAAVAGEQVKTAEDVAGAVARQNAQMAQSSVAVSEAAQAERKAAAAAEDHAAGLAKLLGQLDPTIAALERLDQQEAELQKYRNLGLVDQESFQRFQQQIDASRLAVGRMGVSAGQTAQAMRQLPAQITDVTVSLAAGMPVWMVFLQQGSQIKDSFGGWRPALQQILTILTPTRIAIGLTAGAVAALTVAIVQGYLEAQRLDSALIATGNYAGETASDLQNLAETVGASGGGYANASKAVLQLAQSGKVAHDTFDDAARGVVAFAEVTGSSIEEAVSKFTQLADRPVEGIRALDQQYHFLEASIYAQIRALEEQGRSSEATALAQRTLAAAMEERRQKDEQNLGAIQRAWRSLNDEIARGYDLIKNIGSQNIQQQLDQLYFRRGLAQSLPDFLGKDKIAAIDAQIAALKEQQQAERDAATAAAEHHQEHEKGTDALDRIATTTAKYATDAERYQKQLDSINADFDAAIKAMPEKAAALNAQRNQLIQRAVSAYAESLMPKGTDKAQREAEGQARASAAAQAALLKSIGQLQGQLDPAAAAWERYNQTVAEADRQAEVASKAPGAKKAAIDAERTAVEQLAATIRDADLERLAEKDRQAWESLRRSLETPTEAAVETAMDQIKQLDDLLAKGIINATQYHDALQRIGEKSVVAAPQYQGLDASVGGVGSELAKNFEAQRALDEWHAQQLAANQAFRDQDAANEDAYQARLAEINRQYADQRTKIEGSRQQLTLQASSDFFGQLATLSRSHNSKMAAIGKAAAIAQAIINTYQSATEAYSAMASIPYVGPALGAAAAAAAIAAGLANVAQIRAQPAGYASGGEIRGAGTPTSDSIPIWASDGEFMQRAAAVDYYGVDFMHAVNDLRLPKMAFAEGGPISAPRISAAASPRAPTLALTAPGTTGGTDQGPSKVILVLDKEQLAEELLNTQAGERVTVQHVGNNPRQIQGKWGR